MTYADAIAPARTFGFKSDFESMRKMNLIRGGSIENAIVIDQNGPMQDLRFPDEMVRHKILDMIGDLSLLGFPTIASIRAHKAGHALHLSLANRIYEKGRLW